MLGANILCFSEGTTTARLLLNNRSQCGWDKRQLPWYNKNSLAPKLEKRVNLYRNVFPEEFSRILKKTNKTNQSDRMYFSSASEYEPWDFRDFDIEMMNKTLKQDVESVRFGFER